MTSQATNSMLLIVEICNKKTVQKNLLRKQGYPANIYLFNIYKRNTKKMCEIGSTLTIKTPERRHSGVFIVNFEPISHLFLVFLLITLN